MLKITIPETELFNSETSEFVSVKKTELSLEHSLVSISKWESKWHKPFLGKEEKTLAETRDYVRCMTLTQNVDPNVYLALDGSSAMSKIAEYIDDPMSATWFSDKNQKNQKGSSHKTVTSELIYYWMVALNIPFECQKWHLNRLLTLIRVCNEKNAPKKKMSKADRLKQNYKLNQERRKAMNTSG